MTPLGWFLAGGFTALALERFARRWLWRRWPMLMAAGFAAVTYVAFGKPDQALALASRLLRP